MTVTSDLIASGIPWSWSCADSFTAPACFCESMHKYVEWSVGRAERRGKRNAPIPVPLLRRPAPEA
jgi:hypothetical protein